MADLTKIEWCDATLNLWWGCTKVSEGCKFCYAEHLADHRYNKGNWGPKGTRTEVKSWRATLNKISKRAKTENRRLKVFVQSMSDTFEGPETMGGADSENWKLIQGLQMELFNAIERHPELDFLILTKRPENIAEVLYGWNYCRELIGKPHWYRFPDNAWLGTSVEDQQTAVKRVVSLLQIPAGVLFLSCEPLLGDVRLDRLANHDGSRGSFNCLTGKGDSKVNGHWWDVTTPGKISWVICGGESGSNARPMHPDWARSLRDQCKAAGVPFFFKQWGEWLPGHHYTDELREIDSSLTHSKFQCAEWDGEAFSIGYTLAQDTEVEDALYRVGKHKAGRLLDGVEYNEFPEVQP